MNFKNLVQNVKTLVNTFLITRNYTENDIAPSLQVKKLVHKDGYEKYVAILQNGSSDFNTWYGVAKRVFGDVINLHLTLDKQNKLCQEVSLNYTFENINLKELGLVQTSVLAYLNGNIKEKYNYITKDNLYRGINVQGTDIEVVFYHELQNGSIAEPVLTSYTTSNPQRVEDLLELITVA